MSIGIAALASGPISSRASNSARLDDKVFLPDESDQHRDHCRVPANTPDCPSQTDAIFSGGLHHQRPNSWDGGRRDWAELAERHGGRDVAVGVLGIVESVDQSGDRIRADPLDGLVEVGAFPRMGSDPQQRGDRDLRSGPELAECFCGSTANGSAAISECAGSVQARLVLRPARSRRGGRQRSISRTRQDHSGPGREHRSLIVAGESSREQTLPRLECSFDPTATRSAAFRPRRARPDDADRPGCLPSRKLIGILR